MGKHRQDPVECSMCNGDGKITTWNDGKSETHPCRACNGTGTQP